MSNSFLPGQRLTGFALSVLALLLFSACGTITEEVWINADGSGRYEMRYDADEMLAMLDMMKAMEEMEQAEEVDDEVPAVEDPQDEMMKMFDGERIDTVLKLSTVLPDSVREVVNDRRAMRQAMEAEGRTVTEATLDSVQNAVASLEQLAMMFKMDKAAEQLDFGMRVDFGDASEIAETFGALSALQALGGAASGPAGAGMGSQMDNQTSFSLQGSTLRMKQAVGGSMEQIIESMEGSEMEMDEEQLEQTLEMMGLSAHDIIIHVPGKIKRVDGAAHTLVDDNTVRLTIDYLGMLKGNPPMEVDIQFKRKKKFARTLPLVN